MVDDKSWSFNCGHFRVGAWNDQNSEIWVLKKKTKTNWVWGFDTENCESNPETLIMLWL